MDAKLQKLLSDLGKCVGLTLDFPDGAPIRISGYQNADEPFFLISVDRPDSELIFAILQKIGLVPVQGESFWAGKFPWYINRSYENETVGDIAYKTRRALKQNLNREWRAGLWAMCVYTQVGCPNEFLDFLQRHPEKLKLMPLVFIFTLKYRIGNFFRKLVRPKS
jgi:hypothetical protein